MQNELPEWAMEAAVKAIGVPQDDTGWHLTTDLIEPIARALVDAERRGALAIADMADAYADVSDVKAIHAKSDQENAEYRVEEKTLRQFSAAIRQLGETT